MFRMDEDRARFVDSVTKLLMAVALIVGGGWTLYTYFNARDHEARIAMMEARKPFEAKRLELYLEISASAAKLASGAAGGLGSGGFEEFGKEFPHFRELAIGPLALVQDEAVGKEVLAFRDCLPKHGLGGAESCDLFAASEKLSEACRQSIAKGWDLVLPPNAMTFNSIDKLRH